MKTRRRKSETDEILNDKRLMADIRRGIKDIEEGKVISWELVKKSLLASRGFVKGIKASDIREKIDRM